MGIVISVLALLLMVALIIILAITVALRWAVKDLSEEVRARVSVDKDQEGTI